MYSYGSTTSTKVKFHKKVKLFHLYLTLPTSRNICIVTADLKISKENIQDDLRQNEKQMRVKSSRKEEKRNDCNRYPINYFVKEMKLTGKKSIEVK